MNKYLSPLEFMDVTEPLTRPELRKFGFLHGPFTGGFLPSFYEELLSICEQYPDLHIASTLGNSIKINKPVPDAKIYHLCKGNRDPDYFTDMNHGIFDLTEEFFERFNKELAAFREERSKK